MKMTRIRWGLAALAFAALAGCGGGGSSGTTASVPQTGTAVNKAITAAATDPANDTATNTSSAFTVIQGAGQAAVTVNSPPVVRFTVFSDGGIVKGLTTANVRFAIAKLVPGTDGNPDQWESYIYRTESTATAPNNVGAGAGGTPVLASALQATTDASTPTQLKFVEDGYYEYTFSTDITDPTKTQGTTYEPTKTHRIAIQLSYTNAKGQAVKVNPYFDFTISNGVSVPVTDPTKTRKMVDVGSCNSCHNQLAVHGGGRVDTEYCVMCHNGRTKDANSGNSLDLRTMVHKVHAGKLLNKAAGGEDYTIWGFNASKVSFAEVGFPQDLRNCTKCHNGQDPVRDGEAVKTPQGDNWKTAVSKEACLSCHASKTGSTWDTSHQAIARDSVAMGGIGGTANPAALSTDLTNAQCKACHAAGTPISPENVHWNQNEENAAKYKMVIEGATYNATTRKVTVQYYLADPTNNNAAYNLVTSDCSVSAGVPNCGTSTKFGNVRLYLAYQNMIGQPANQTEWTGGSGINAYAYKGTNDGNNHYTIDLPAIPADVNTPALIAANPASAPAKAFGTARVFSIGQIKEPLLNVKSNTRPRPEVSPQTLINTIVQNSFLDLSLDGSTVSARREVVSSAKCNACHGALGTSSGANTLREAFHSGARDTVEACPVCHDVNRASTGNMMTDGSALYESYQFKRMIHGIHGNTRRTYPFTHGNRVQGLFSKAGVLDANGGKFFADYTASIKINNAATGTTTIVIPANTAVSAGATFDAIAQQMTTALIATKGSNGDTSTTAAVAAAENYAAEVAWPGGQDFKAPGTGVNCNVCHVNNSYQNDLSPLGTMVTKPAGALDPMTWKVITPKAASCSACHDSPTALAHMTTPAANGAFGTVTQGVRGQEGCSDCHAIGAVKGVDVVHGQ